MRHLLLIAFLASILSSCAGNEEPPAPAQPVLHLTVHNLGSLDSSREQYVLWLHEAGGAWQTQPLTWSSDAGSDSLETKLPSMATFDSALLSVEPITVPPHPTSIIAAGAVRNNRASLTTDHVLPGLSDASATATFTTHATDTNRARHEFYLMRSSSGNEVTSISDLPEPPAGWKYGLWVCNTNFYPAQNFFFGSFTSDEGASSGGFASAFPFPGGYYPGTLTSESSDIVVTLEPDANLALRPHIASPVKILSGRLHRFISLHDTIELSNVWMPPVAQLVIQ